MTSTLLNGPAITRRGMLAGLGGLTFGLAFGADGIRLLAGAQAAANDAAKFSPWVRIAPDGTVTILSAGAEMGQGSMTSLPLILAEEMDADWSKVVIEWAPADPAIYGYTFGNERMMAIVGSRAVMLYYNDLRIAGAQVRKVLLHNAAEKWGVAVARLTTEPGYVVDTGSGRRMSYGEIAGFAKLPEKLPAVDKSELKDKSQFRLIGKQVPRRDIPAKVNGTAQYAIDVKLPGMVYAATLHAPVHGSTPESWNEAELKAMPGVIGTVKLPTGVAVVAEHFEQAIAGRGALDVKWAPGKAAGFDSERALEVEYAKVHADPAAAAERLDGKGDVKAAFASAAKTYKAEYRSDYGYHATMEPLNAVARVEGGKAEVWDGSQAPDSSRAMVAQALGLKPDDVTFHQCYMGGGFGRRGTSDYTAEAAFIARAVGKPGKSIWTREEDIANGMFRPQSFQCLEAAQDAGGKVTGWRHCVIGDGGILLVTGIRIPYYDVPNQHIERRGVSHGMRITFWRAVGHVFNTFAIESFVDQMAVDAGMDPIQFRLERMAAIPRARRVFEAVAGMSDWKAKRPEGRALGCSLVDRSRSMGAGVAEISLDRASGKIRVHKVWMAVDGGVIVTPDAAKANVESAIVHGISSVLHERVTVKDGAVEQSNFHDYSVMRMSDLPEEMNITFVPSDNPPSGLGEIGNPWIAAAVANGFYRLTGKRLTHMPFTPERVLAALKA